jgi:hypothetical protein
MSGTRLLSAGWVWHPWDAVVFYDVEAALADPKRLDSLADVATNSQNVTLAEESAGAWQSDNCVLLGGSEEAEDPAEAAELAHEPRLHPRGIAVYDVRAKKYISGFTLGEPPGAMMAVGMTHVIAFYRHPKLISLRTGKVLHAWDDLNSGLQTSSISRGLAFPPPPLAMDPLRCRFAVADQEHITIIQLNREILSLQSE